jgi:hypothetical protein
MNVSIWYDRSHGALFTVYFCGKVYSAILFAFVLTSRLVLGFLLVHATFYVAGNKVSNS